MPGLTLARQRKPEKGKAPEARGVEAARGRASTAISSTTARPAARDRARSRACRRTSSFTTPRCASSRASSRAARTQLSHIYGIGARKAEDLGDVILDAIRTHAGVS